MDLFEYMRENSRRMILWQRMRPTSLDDVVGQEHIIGKDKLFVQGDKSG